MAYLICANGEEVSLMPHEYDTFGKKQKLVGGYIEYVYLLHSVLIVNEEGLINDLPPNPTATMWAERLIVGDCIKLTREEFNYSENVG